MSNRRNTYVERKQPTKPAASAAERRAESIAALATQQADLKREAAARAEKRAAAGT
jgi:hypothetical protein